MRIAIVDDEQKDYEQLAQHIRHYGKEKKEKFAITYFKDGSEMTDIRKEKYDIIFMDIAMKSMDGINVALEIRKWDTEVVIIFVTDTPQFALRGYEVSALDYLLKPVCYELFCWSMDRAVNMVYRKKEVYILIQVSGCLQRVKVSEITYVENLGHRLVYHTLYADYEAYGSIKEAAERLKPFHFIRINKGYLINLEYVSNVKDECAVIDEKKLPVSRAKRQEFLKELALYIGEY